MRWRRRVNDTPPRRRSRVPVTRTCLKSSGTMREERAVRSTPNTVHFGAGKTRILGSFRKKYSIPLAQAPFHPPSRHGLGCATHPCGSSTFRDAGASCKSVWITTGLRPFSEDRSVIGRFAPVNIYCPLSSERDGAPGVSSESLPLGICGHRAVANGG